MGTPLPRQARATFCVPSAFTLKASSGCTIIHGSERRAVDNDISLGLIEGPIYQAGVRNVHLLSDQGQNRVTRPQVGHEIPAQHPCTACYKNLQSFLYLGE
jgi:hypothetical protein